MLTATAHVRKSRKSNPKKDEDILKERFSMSFLGDYPSFHIARTMAEESSKNHEELVVSASTTWDRTNKCQSSNMHSLSLSLSLVSFKEKFYTPTPLDFVPRNRKLTDSQLEVRLMHWTVLDRRTDGKRNTPDEALRGQKFRDKINQLRDTTYALLGSRIDRHFEHEMTERYGQLCNRHGQRILNPRDHSTHVKLEPKMTIVLRGQSFFALHGIWGTRNDWADVPEEEVLDKFGLSHKPTLSDGTTPTKNTKGGWAKTLAARKKEIACEPIQNNLRIYHCEGIFVRHKCKHKKEDKKEVTRLLNKRGLVKLVEATFEEHGFCGYLGLYEGHPDLVEKPKKQEEKNQAKEDHLLAWFQRKRKSGEITGFGDIAKLARLEKNNDMDDDDSESTTQHENSESATQHENPPPVGEVTTGDHMSFFSLSEADDDEDDDAIGCQKENNSQTSKKDPKAKVSSDCFFRIELLIVDCRVLIVLVLVIRIGSCSSCLFLLLTSILLAHINSSCLHRASRCPHRFSSPHFSSPHWSDTHGHRWF